MKFFSRLAASAALAATLVAGAMPAEARSNGDHHIQLLETVRAQGINVQVNPAECFEDTGVMGFYSGQRRLLVSCQPGRVNSVGQIADFNEEDFDTFRHEVHHFVQDCMIGTNHDHLLGPVYEQPVDLAIDVLGREKSARIIGVYKGNGANDHVLVLELEAFAVAALNDPLEQVKDVRNYCGS